MLGFIPDLALGKNEGAKQLGIVAHAYNTSTLETGAGGL